MTKLFKKWNYISRSQKEMGITIRTSVILLFSGKPSQILEVSNMIMCFFLPTLWVGWAVLVLPGLLNWDGWYNWTALSLWVLTFHESRPGFLKWKWQHSKWKIPNMQVFINPLPMSYFLVPWWQITSKQNENEKPYGQAQSQGGRSRHSGIEEVVIHQRPLM